MQTAVENDKTPDSALVQRINIDATGSIVMIRLNRPSRANAYNTAMLSSLERELRTMIESKVVRAMILTGEGNRSFCAGADKDELKDRRAEEGLKLQSRELFGRVATLPVPTIAAINGAAVGGGLELALACDIRVCAKTAKFFLPELSLGLTPAAGGMHRLPAIIGKSRTKEIILFGRELDTVTALEWGLVSYVGDDFEAQALELARRAATHDPLALLLSKKIIDSDQNLERQDLTELAQALLYERKFKRNHP